MNQFNYFILLFFLGFPIAIILKIQRREFFFYLSSFTFGSMIWVVSVWILGILALTYSYLGLFIIIGVIECALFFLIMKYRLLELNVGNILQAGFALGISAGIFWFFTGYNYTFVSPDSFHFIYAGREFKMLGWENVNNLYYNAYGLFLPFIQSAFQLVKLEYLYGYIPVISSLSYLSIGLLSYYILTDLMGGFSKLKIQYRSYQIGIPMPALLVILALLLILSDKFVQQFFVYFHSNMLASITLTLTLLTGWLAYAKKSLRWLGVSSLFLWTLSFVRVETIILYPIYIYTLTYDSKLLTKQIQRLFIPQIILHLLWSIREPFWGLSYEGNFGADYYLYVIILIFVLTLAYILLLDRIRTLNLPLDLIGLGILGSILVAPFIIVPERMFTSFSALYWNMTNLNIWNLTWFFVPLFFLYGLVFGRFKHDKFLKVSILVFLLILFDLPFIRGGLYHERWGDLGNRMLIHILPSMVLFSVFSIFCGTDDVLEMTVKDEEVLETTLQPSP